MILAQQEEAVNWLFGLEGPALIVTIIMLVAVSFAFYRKDKALAEAQLARISDNKESQTRDRDALENTLTVVSGVQNTLDKIAVVLANQGGEIVGEVQTCSLKVEEAGKGIEKLLERIPQQARN